jgi:hypothetical protein
MFGKLKNVLGLDKAELEAKAKKEAEVQAAMLAKKEAAKAKREAKKAMLAKELETQEKFELPPVEVEPFIKVISVDFEGGDPRKGSFELEWNKEFILWLRTAGYPGATDEAVVDLWFEEMCRNVALQTYEQFDADPTNRNYVQVEDLGNGRKGVS